MARASLNDELLHDYESFLRQNGLRVWPKDSRPALAMRERLRQDHVTNLPVAPEGRVRLTGLAGLAEFVGKAEAEIAANAMICAIHQAVYLLKRQIEAQGRQFTEEGGFSEKMYRQRQNARQRKQSDRSDTSDGHK